MTEMKGEMHLRFLTEMLLFEYRVLGKLKAFQSLYGTKQQKAVA